MPSQDWDLELSERERMFLYLPLGHSEDLRDQVRAVELVEMRMPNIGDMYLLHARAHREVIRRFGRFPMRNEILGRPNTPAEADFLTKSGYGALIQEMQSWKN